MITIREGFLMLTADDGRTEFVRASSISRVSRWSENTPIKTLVTIGNEGWSIGVNESPESVIDAIGTANRVHP
jgi:hypothetical protein